MKQESGSPLIDLLFPDYFLAAGAYSCFDFVQLVTKVKPTNIISQDYVFVRPNKNIKIKKKTYSLELDTGVNLTDIVKTLDIKKRLDFILSKSVSASMLKNI